MSQSWCGMRRCVLCGRWARLAFPRAREKKALVVVAQLAKIVQACQSNSCLPAPERGLLAAPAWRPATPAKHGEWRRRAGGASIKNIGIHDLQAWPQEAAPVTRKRAGVPKAKKGVGPGRTQNQTAKFWFSGLLPFRQNREKPQIYFGYKCRK